MSWVAVGVTAVSIGMSYEAGQQGKAAAGREAQLQQQAGRARKAAANFEADVLETQATQRIAIAQRDMVDAQRTAQLVQSRAQAVSAASGGGTGGTALTIMGNIAKEGAYNASRAMYSGEEAARTMRMQAFEKRAEGEFAEAGGNLQSEAALSRGQAAQYSSYASIAGSVGGLYGKYGKPGATTGDNQSTGYFRFNGYDSAGGPAYG